MNRSNFNQTGGYPLKTERLQEQQKAFEIFNAFGALAGNLTIISGCNTVGSTVQDGFIYINGEIIEFRQADGAGNPTVIIIEEPVNASFENGTVKTVYYVRYATFGAAETSWLWSEFKRPFETKNIPGDLNTQLGAIPGKAETTTVTSLTARITALENAVALIKTPQIKIWSGFETVTSWTSAGDYSNTFTRNYVDVFPPAGYTMAHFQGMVPSISQIKFSGDVNEDDVLWCKWQLLTDRVRIMCGDSEMRAAPMINHLSVWIK